MSNLDNVASKLEDYYGILKYLKQNYPDILLKWKSKATGAQEQAPAAGDAIKRGSNSDDSDNRIGT